MDLQLKGKTAFVTGSTAGIGLAIAKMLAAEGANVIINGRTDERIQEAIASIKEDHDQATVTGLVADFKQADSVEKLLDQLPEIDILVNNVGIFAPVQFSQITDEQWHEMLEVNLMSGIKLSRKVFDQMIARDWGRIIFVSSESGVQIPGDMIHYGVSKAAQIALANGMAKLTKGTGVTVNSVLPGSTMSEGASNYIDQVALEWGMPKDEVEAEFVKTGRPSALLGRFGTVEEVASMVCYLCSPLASATNSAAIRVDGGALPNML